MHTALFSQQHEETMKDRTGLMGKRETERKDESRAKTRERERERGDIRKLSSVTEKAATSEQRCEFAQEEANGE